MIHYGIGYTSNVRRGLCGEQVSNPHRLPANFVDYENGALRGLAVAAPDQRVDCASCLSLFVEAHLLHTRFLICPDCMGSGNRDYGKQSFIAITSCMKCLNSGLVLAGHGGRAPVP